MISAQLCIIKERVYLVPRICGIGQACDLNRSPEVRISIILDQLPEVRGNLDIEEVEYALIYIL